ncbi:FRG domain-containing protein [Sulfitobacter sp. HGT1]|uniref:FRG domain-containing protein n=1 Tax=Sulfitobacter sp. HGT1 TaxID=2735435 RepID=UPI001592F72C|nr:FRG domain-containing protein [Sulfitobacter sp. HGT1]
MSENFNYISITDKDRINDNMTILRGRLFESTPVAIEKRLEGLSDKSVTFLKSLPTFVCSEIDSHADGNSMVIKYGRIADLKHSDLTVSITFDTLMDFGEVNFDNVEDAHKIFSVDRIQLYRGHWAVREGDSVEVLRRLSDFFPKFSEGIDRLIEQPEVDAEIEPPPREKKILGTATDVASFLKLLYEAPLEEDPETFFRGHGTAKYELSPFLLRKWENGDWKFLPNEDRLCKELLIAHYDEFQSDQYCFDRLVRMQHFGLPTRMLDITGNPLMALFFACSSQPQDDGEVIIFQVTSDAVKYYDSDTVSCLSNLSNLTYEQKNTIDVSLEQGKFNKSEVVGKLLHHIKSEKGFFEGRIIPKDLSSIVCVKAKRTNSRIKSQSGAFLLFGHEAKLPDVGQKGIRISRITVKAEEKIKILAELDRINVNDATVYPSIGQTADHLREQYQSKVRETEYEGR